MCNKFIVISALLAIYSVNGFAEESGISAGVSSDRSDKLGTGLEEIIVTARRRDEKLQDVPISISAFSSDMIEVRSAVDLQDIADSVPNVLYSESGNGNEADISMRGVFSNINQVGFDQGVSIYLDGVYLGKSMTSNVALNDIERVEVLRGPQGTLFGKNSIAGAVNITTKKPGDEFSGRIKAGVGNYDALNLEASADIPLVEDLLTVRLAIRDARRDGYVKNLVNGDKLANVDETSLRAQFYYAPTERTDITLSMDAFKSDVLGYYHEPTDGNAGDDGVPYKTSINVTDNKEEKKLRGISLTGEHEFQNDFKLTSITGWRDDEASHVRDTDSQILVGIRNELINEQTQWSQELRLSSPVNEKYDYLIGLYYYKQDVEFDEYSDIGPARIAPGIEGLINWRGEIDVESAAVFFHGNFNVTENWRVFGGIRYTNETKKLTHIQSVDTESAILDSIVYSAVTNAKTDSGEVSWNVGIQYNFNEDLQIYGSASRGFKSGGFNATFISEQNVIDGITVDPEFVNSYEIGLKSSWLDNNLRVNFTIFHLDYKDLQVLTFNPNAGVNNTGGYEIDNAAEVGSDGFELELTASPFTNFLWDVSVGYVDSEFDSFPGLADINGVPFDGKGNEVPLSPKWTVNTGAAYELVLPNGGILSSSLRYSYIGERYSDVGSNNDPIYRLSGYGLLNGRLGYTSPDESWSISLWGKNITDKLARHYRSLEFAFGMPIFSKYIEPRTYGVDLKYNF